MTSGQKIAFSMLLSMLIFAGFVVGANVRLFSELETRFYAGSKVSEKIHHLDEAGESLDAYISNFLKRAETFTHNQYVSSYMEQNPSEKLVSERRRLTENLFKESPALIGIRIVDKNGKNVHYSSFDSSDLLKQNGISKVYKNYYDIQKDCDEVDFNLVKVSSNYKVFVDSKKARLIISLPFYLFGNVQNGVMLCYLNLYEIREELTAKNVIGYGENFAIFSDDDLNGGIVLGIPLNAVEEFRTSVLESWSRKLTGFETFSGNKVQPQKILSTSDGAYWTILSTHKEKYINLSGVYPSSTFELSQDLIWLIYISVFMTVFLFLYLLFSLRGEPLASTRKKISQLQRGIIEEYLDRRQDVDWTKMAEVLRLRKSDFVERLRNDLAKKSKKHGEEVNALLERAWNDIITVFEKYEHKAPASENSSFSMNELRAMIEDVLRSRGIEQAAIPAAEMFRDPVVPEVKTPVQDEVEEIAELEEEPVEDVEEISELEEETAEDVEEISELEEESAEDVEEIADLEEEPVEDVEEIADLEEETADDVEEIAELEEESAEDVEEIADLEEEPADDVEEIAELEEEPADDVEELEDLEEESEEELDDLEEVPEESDEVDELEEVEEISDLEDVEDEATAIEDLPEYDEFPGEEVHNFTGDDVKKTFYSVDNLIPDQNEYIEDEDSFIRSEKFANVSDLFAEEISLGSEYDFSQRKHQSDVMKFKIHPLSEIIDDDETKDKAESDDKLGVLEGSEKLLEDIEELTDAFASDNSAGNQPAQYFSMTAFGKNLDDVHELEPVEDGPKATAEEVIKENDGVFQISDKLDYSSDDINADFKKLVDSVLKK